jgi:hypothetical protein
MNPHSNLQEAKKACQQYVEKNNALQEQFQVWEENEDSSCAVYVKAYYLDENGQKKHITIFNLTKRIKKNKLLPPRKTIKNLP